MKERIKVMPEERADYTKRWDKVVTAAAIPRSQRIALEELASGRSCSIGTVVREAISRYLETADAAG